MAFAVALKPDGGTGRGTTTAIFVSAEPQSPLTRAQYAFGEEEGGALNVLDVAPATRMDARRAG